MTVRASQSGALQSGQANVPNPAVARVKIDFETDLGNAQRFVKRHGKNVRFIPEWRKWIIWDGNRWEVDNDGAVVRLAKETVWAMYGEALRRADQRQQTALFKHALKSQSEARLNAMVSLAQTELEVVLSAKALDLRAWSA